MNLPPHERVWEYDGAFKCFACQKSWGALPGRPKMPVKCELSENQRRIQELEKEIESRKSELDWRRSKTNES